MITLNEAVINKADYYGFESTPKIGDKVECNLDFLSSDKLPKIGGEFLMHDYYIRCDAKSGTKVVGTIVRKNNDKIK